MKMSMPALPICGLVLAVLLAGCASAPPAREVTAEEEIGARALQRWNALIEGRWEDAYALLTPGYREAQSLEAYKGSFVGTNVQWLSARVEGVACDAPERCVARVEIEFQLKGGLRGVPEIGSRQGVEEIWLRSEDDWYHLPRR